MSSTHIIIPVIRRLALPVACALFCAALAACSTAFSHLADGLKADRAGDHATALAEYTQAIERDSSLFEAFYNRALLHYRHGRYRRALPDFTQALSINPDDAAALWYRAQIHHALANYDSAVADHTRRIALDPYNARAHYDRGVVRHEAGAYDQALDDFSLALSFDPYMPDAFSAQGQAYAATEQYDEAMRSYNRAIEIRRKLLHDLASVGYNRYWNPHWPPNTPDSVRLKAVQRITAQYRTAMAYYYTLRADLYHVMRQYDDAVAGFREAISWDSTYSTAYGNMGWIAYLQGDFDRCIALSEYTIRLDGAALYARYNRALALLRLGRSGEARNAYRETLDYARFLTGEGQYAEQNMPPEDIPARVHTRVAAARKGALGDLRDLLQQHIQTDEVRSIMQDVFGEQE